MKGLKDKIFHLYEELAKIDEEKEYETFCAQWGEEYKKGGLMFVGRAVNDWVTQGDRDTVRMFQNGSENQSFARADQMVWVENTQYYRKSQFWRVVKAVTQRATPCVEVDWYKHIVWSNLYKFLQREARIHPIHYAQSRCPYVSKSLRRRWKRLTLISSFV